MHWGMGGRIATTSLRTGLAMTPFESLPLPFRASAYTGVGISGADDPVRRVRGLLECIGAGLCPHSRRKEYPCMNSQHKRGARRGIRRRDHAKARHEIGMLRYAGQKVTDAVGTSAAERIPKPLGLAAFFGYFLSLVTENTPSEALDNRCGGQKSAARMGRAFRLVYAIWFTGPADAGTAAPGWRTGPARICPCRTATCWRRTGARTRTGSVRSARSWWAAGIWPSE